MITSCTALVPTSTAYDNTSGFRETTQARRMMYARVWHFLAGALDEAIFPCGQSNVPGAYNGGLGGNKYDWNTWNPLYWTRMHEAFVQAQGVGVYAELMLFDRVSMSPASDTRWGNNPWAANNNINNLEVPNAQPPNDGTPDFYRFSTKPNLRFYQEKYLRKMIDETIIYDNMLYEIENEHWQDPTTAWADYVGSFVKSHIAANYPSSPRLTSYSSLDSDLESTYTLSSVDIVNAHFGNSAEDDPNVLNTYIEPRWVYNKPINIDEFANGLTDANILRRMCWTIIISGGHFHIEDAATGEQTWEVLENIRSFKALANWNFVGAAPNKNLITAGGGYCLAKVGEEYVCYFPSGGSKTVNLAAATYRGEWWNPRTGAFYGVSSFAHAGGNRSFSTPDTNDWVLHVTTRPAFMTVLESGPAGTMTINGNTSDWNLPQFGTQIVGGNAGTGNVGIVGFNGYENWTCYAGGHLTGRQFPPGDPADHAVQFYSLHDANYVYFLFRTNDSDRRTPNPVSGNATNDSVAIYIDPGNAGGISPLANSTSAVQLVIDAANQKNVYGCTSGYATQVLNGVTSAVATDAAGWWLEVRISKTALSPALPASTGTIGVDFSFYDNDANSTAQSTNEGWHDPELSAGFPSRIPDRWGKLSLVTTSSLPDVASDPSPAQQATGIGLNPQFNWTPGAGTTSHNVFFGTVNPPPFVVNQSAPPFAPGFLTSGTTYYWRINEVNDSGTAIGPVWSFTTGVFSIADFDYDNDVDLSDFAHLQVCRTMTGQFPAGPCEDADLNNDNAVDNADFSLFLPCMAGANLPPGC